MKIWAPLRANQGSSAHRLICDKCKKEQLCFIEVVTVTKERGRREEKRTSQRMNPKAMEWVTVERAGVFTVPHLPPIEIHLCPECGGVLLDGLFETCCPSTAQVQPHLNVVQARAERRAANAVPK